MFDWDKDQEELVAPATIEPKVSEASSLGWLRKLGGLLLGCALLLGVAYEKDMVPQLRGGSLGGMTFPLPSSAPPVNAELPGTLAVYDSAQAHVFLHGLRAADVGTLRAYAARTEDDIRRASPDLVPYLQDAAALLSFELARRLASAS